MDATRLGRLKAVIQEEIAVAISREIRDPRVTPLTVTQVELSPDAGMATIYIALLGGEGNIADCLAGLRSASGFLKRKLAKALMIRTTPDITFKEDKGLANSARVHELLSVLKAQESSRPGLVDAAAASDTEEQTSVKNKD